MKVYVGKFRYIYDGDTDVIVATTRERIERELIRMAEEYTEFLDEDEKKSLENNPNTFNEWNDIGGNNEWFELQWVQTEVLSDEHILKHAMEVI
tara:strand:- start:172 stop:453 length:282 start_codon:yes stop_codon:yes gene_type:complete